MNQDENTGNIVIIEYYDIKEEELYKNNDTMPMGVSGGKNRIR